MTPTMDWWNACQSGNLSHEDWKRQLTQAAALLPSSSPFEELKNNSPYRKLQFRAFDEWQREVSGDVDMPLTITATSTALEEPRNNSHGSLSKSKFTEKLSSEAELAEQHSSDNDTDVEDVYSTSHLYHQTLTKRPMSRTHHRQKIESLTGRDVCTAEDTKMTRNVKNPNVGGQQRRERKIRYRLTGAFQRVKNILSGEIT
jgi:hypothetical protein